MGLCWEELGAQNQFRLGKLHYAKSKHYSCHRDEDLQQQQFPCPSWCIKYLTRSRVMLPQCHVFWRVWWLSWHCWCKILNLRPLPSFPYLFTKICWKDFCVPRGETQTRGKAHRSCLTQETSPALHAETWGGGGKWHKNGALVWATLNIIPVHELYNICIGTDTSYLIYVKGEWESGFPRLCPIAGNEAQGSSPSKAVLIYKGRGSGGFFLFFFFFK